MPLSWNEIKQRAISFSKEWDGETRENAEAKTFWNDFFQVFDISRRRVASFEEPVKKLGNRQGFIDLFWKGNLIVEHKSKGLDLDKAYNQAIDYFAGLREEELPKYILVSDFARFRLYDLDNGTINEFHLIDFHKNIKLFGFIAGYRKIQYHNEHPINIKAAERMGRLHDRLKEVGYNGKELEIYLCRLLFLLFADDTGIFQKDIFWDFVENRTSNDGSDLADKLAHLFQVLNTPNEKRLKNLDETFVQFPYINGRLFEEVLPIAAFDSGMRKLFLECCSIDWSLISPAIFGSLFQSIMDNDARRNLGAHYTSEKNILKLIKPLFLDELWTEFHRIKQSAKQLSAFHKKLGEQKFLDPACGSGNFLIIAYRELRLLELEILKEIHKNQKVTNIENIVWLNIDQFYGIEIDEWAARIAEVAMWLVDHQMNMLISDTFGDYFARIPLKKSANIVHGNSLQIDWQSLLNPVNPINIVAKHTNIYVVNEPDEEYKTLNVKTQTFDIHQGEPPQNQELIKFDYIMGNPPFIGKYLQTELQKSDLEGITNGITGAGVLDYVCGWFIKAAKYIRNTAIKVAFVSTNSISQGEQVGILWNELIHRYKIKIHFAHRTFKWSNEARGNAAVHVVIIGFANFNTKEKLLFDYEDIKSEPEISTVTNINPYLIEGEDIVVTKQRKSICNAKPISFGSMPNDGGFLLFTDEEKIEFLQKEPQAEKYMKQLVSAYEFLNGKKRWCLWLATVDPVEIKRYCPEISKRIAMVQKHRESSNRAITRKLAAFPMLFGENRQPETDYIAIPRVSSEDRIYIPIGFFSKDYIASDSCLTIPNATYYDFGMLMSKMHVAWVKYVCGRMKSDFRYSNEIVYNNYPFPKEVSDKLKEKVEKATQNVLDARAKYPNSSLAELYNTLFMPSELARAHQELDKAVDSCYRLQPFVNERSRIEFLFGLYNQYVAPLQAEMVKYDKKSKRKGKIS